MKVICINNVNNFNKNDLTINIGLTIGKIYDVTKTSRTIYGGEAYTVVNDLGKEWIYSRDVLLPLKECREERLNELGIL
jgi:hypothetical protein